jgi:hypothetical protein
MKSWIRRFALLAVMGSIVGGIVMAGCSSSEAPEDNTAAPAEGAPPADPGAPPAAPAPPAPPAP